MQTIQKDGQTAIGYNGVTGSTTATDKFVMNFCEACTILLPGGTANLSVFANNDREYYTFAQDSTDYLTSAGIAGFDSLSARNSFNPSFSAHWVNITSDPSVKIGANAFYIQEASFRFVRLQGLGALTAVGYVWTTNMGFQ